MPRSVVPLNALRAFEAAARHLSFTRAADELCVTQAAISHQVKGLEDRLGVALFRRSNRGLMLTDEGVALAPTLFEAFGAIDRLFEQFEAGGVREVLTVSAVGTFVVGALLERLPAFRAAHPLIDLRILTNNNKVDIVAEGLDYAIRFGDGAWHGSDAELICTAPLSPLCAPGVAEQFAEPADLLRAPLLRSYRPQDWLFWFKAAGLEPANLRGPLFDSSLIMAQAAIRGEGVALAPHGLFRRELESGQLVRPFRIEVDVGGYWLTRLKSREPTAAMAAFRSWLVALYPSKTL
ncbi:LysR family transcriptional regulator [Caulobacter sp. S45]|uniref:LysR family transcriptional regulator n=1 Tax=Caulobacter sp. S45 TaxID=1641861 RepID=UPI00131E9588|nr:LysR family transcriptional regulator [Caulobacter sp. S45]